MRSAAGTSVRNRLGTTGTANVSKISNRGRGASHGSGKSSAPIGGWSGKHHPHHSNSSYNNHSHSLLKRRVVFGILAVCVTLSRVAAQTLSEQQQQKAGRSTSENSTSSQTDTSSPREDDALRLNCTAAAIEEFPKWPLDSFQRAKGGMALNFAIAIYLIMALGIICDDYFVPVLEMICDALKLSSDVAGATFMAAGTSSPEFFTNIMGTFVTQTDLGIGTIVGSAVFNIFGVISVCGIFAGRKIPLHWYPITRDCLIYGITVVVLIVVLVDEKVYWYESLVMISVYVVYIVLMMFNAKIERWALSSKTSVSKRFHSQTVPNELTPLQSPVRQAQVPRQGIESNGISPATGAPSVSIAPASNNSSSASMILTSENTTASPLPNAAVGTPLSPPAESPMQRSVLTTSTTQDDLMSQNNNCQSSTTITVIDSVRLSSSEGGTGHHSNNSPPASDLEIPPRRAPAEGGDPNSGEEEEEEEELLYPWQLPSNAGIVGILWWALMLPVNFLLFLTIPDMRRADPDGDGCTSTNTFRKLYPLSFVMCMAWIGAISYVVTWMITIIGVDLGIPDSVMGLSFLAVGTSIPEVFSSLIVCRQGKGSMAVSNSIGSNTFDILVCLGFPWLVKSILNGKGVGNVSSHLAGDFLVPVNSEGLAYTVISLLLSLIILYVILLLSKFELTKFTAIICLVIYVVFFTVSILFELNVFFQVNLPTCPTTY